MVDFNYLINECLHCLFAIGYTLICKLNIVKFVIPLSLFKLKYNHFSYKALTKHKGDSQVT